MIGSIRAFGVARLVLVAALVAGCTTSSVPPMPTPADFGGLSQVLQARGLTILNVVSGNAGCPNPDLARTAITFTASGLDQATAVQMYLYVFNDRAAFVRRSTDVGSCAQSYVTDPQAYESLAISPYVLSGQGPWAPSFKAQLQAGLTVAAGDGGTSSGGGYP
ncbi:MAG: hypothetical protein ACYDAK_04595 [Candidatus Limnocylindrales bacterium]